MRTLIEQKWNLQPGTDPDAAAPSSLDALDLASPGDLPDPAGTAGAQLAMGLVLGRGSVAEPDPEGLGGP